MATCNAIPVSFCLNYDHILHLMTVPECTVGCTPRKALYCEGLGKDEPVGHRLT